MKYELISNDSKVCFQIFQFKKTIAFTKLQRQMLVENTNFYLWLSLAVNKNIKEEISTYANALAWEKLR